MSRSETEKQMAAFLARGRPQMVRFAARLLGSLGASRAKELADDVVQDACIYYLGANDSWDEARFVGAVRFAAMRAYVVANHTFVLRNTADGSRGKTRRAKVTSFFPSQVFGMGLADAAASRELLDEA